MKIIFLDIDGVLNTTNHEASQSFMTKKHHICEENFNNLKLLVKQGNYQIVISSTWRKDKNFIEDAINEKQIIQKFIDLFEQHGWLNAPIIGITPNLSGFRGQEVATYLDNINDNVEYIILDDDKDFILSSLLDISLAKLDRLGIRSYEEAKEKSLYWSNQALYLVNPLTGLTKENIEEMLTKSKLNFKKNEILHNNSKKMK